MHRDELVAGDHATMRMTRRSCRGGLPQTSLHTCAVFRVWEHRPTCRVPYHNFAAVAINLQATFIRAPLLAAPSDDPCLQDLRSNAHTSYLVPYTAFISDTAYCSLRYLVSYMSDPVAARLPIVQRLLRDFPCLTPRHRDLKQVDGYVKLAASSYRISLRTDCSVLRADDALYTLLSPHSATVLRRLSLAPDAHALLLELRTLAERAAADPTHAAADRSPSPAELPPRSFYERLLRDVSALGWRRVHLHDSLRALDVIATDAGNREHTLSLRLPPNYPQSPPTALAALPEPFALRWDATCANAGLCSALAQFERRLRDFQPLWDALDDIDAHCRVLEPERPTRAHAFRRIALDAHTSVRIELDPRAPVAAFPTCRFLGAQAAVAPLRARLNAHIHLWDATGATPPRRNLETVLAVSLPAPRATQADGAADEVECGICYAYRLEGAVPDVACDRPACAKPYHRACLVEWLRALPDTRQSFETLMGACVYCEHAITVSVNES